MTAPGQRATWHPTHVRSVVAILLAGLAARTAMLAWGVWRRDVPWTRLLLPSILLLEGVALWDGALGALWPVRLGTVLALELAFVAMAIRALRRTPGNDEPVEVRLATALRALVPPLVARLAAIEIVLVGMAVRFLAGGWRRPIPPGITYHRDSGLRLLLPVLPLLAVGDVMLLEVVVLANKPAWLEIAVHAVSAYGLIWLVGLYASLRERPHRVDGDRLILHRGILKRLVVPTAEVVSVTPLREFTNDWKKRAYLKGATRLDVGGGRALELRLRDGARVILSADGQ